MQGVRKAHMHWYLHAKIKWVGKQKQHDRYVSENPMKLRWLLV